LLLSWYSDEARAERTSPTSGCAASSASPDGTTSPHCSICIVEPPSTGFDGVQLLTSFHLHQRMASAVDAHRGGSWMQFPAASISVEVMFYLLFPLIASDPTMHRAIMFIVGTLAIALWQPADDRRDGAILQQRGDQQLHLLLVAQPLPGVCHWHRSVLILRRLRDRADMAALLRRYKPLPARDARCGITAVRGSHMTRSIVIVRATIEDEVHTDRHDDNSVGYQHGGDHTERRDRQAVAPQQGCHIGAVAQASQDEDRTVPMANTGNWLGNQK